MSEIDQDNQKQLGWKPHAIQASNSLWVVINMMGIVQ